MEFGLNGSGQPDEDVVVVVVVVVMNTLNSSIGVNATGVTGVRPPIFDLQGPLVCWTPAIISTHSRVLSLFSSA